MKRVRNTGIVVLAIAITITMGQWSGVFAAAGTVSSASTSVNTQSTSQMLNGKSYAKDELLVTYDTSLSNSKIKKNIAGKDADCEAIKKTATDQKVAQVTISDDATMKQAINEFKTDSKVVAVQPNYKYKVSDTESDPYMNASAGRNYQYQFTKTNAKAAWAALENGTHSQTNVAVIDTGVDASHEDLQTNMGKNSLPRYTQILNGKITDTEDDADTEYGHGTHVTGIIGATYGDGKGGSGIASGTKNDLVNVMTVGASKDGENLYTFDIVNAIKYAVDKNSKVINMSFGVSARDRVMEAAIKDAYTTKGVVFVAASGNDDTNVYCSPGGIKEVISVNASNDMDKAVTWSNYGTATDVTAPGDMILSTIPGDSYGLLSGTSMASPVVTGIAALVLDANPDLTPAQVYNIICATASGNGDFNGTDVAYGIINAEAAVNAAKKASESTSVTSISIKETSIDLYAGDDHGLETLTLPATSLKATTWTSNNENVATVDSYGNVTGVSAGNTTVKATCDGHAVTCNVNVKAPVKATSLSIVNKADKAELAVGDTETATTILAPSNVTNDEVYWTSSDRNVARADEGGTITGVGAGTATITAKNYDGTVTDSFSVTVKSPATSVKLTSTVDWLQLGDTFTFAGTLYDENGSTDVAYKNIYWLSSNRRVAKVDSSTGKVTPVSAGRFYVSAYDSNMNFYAYKWVTIAKKDYSGSDYNLKKVKRTKHTIKIKWNKIPIASGYVIERKSSKNGTFKTVKTVTSGSTLTYKDKKLASGKKYYYKVKATYIKDNVNKSFSYSKVVAVKTK